MKKLEWFVVFSQYVHFKEGTQRVKLYFINRINWKVLGPHKHNLAKTANRFDAWNIENSLSRVRFFRGRINPVVKKHVAGVVTYCWSMNCSNVLVIILTNRAKPAYDWFIMKCKELLLSRLLMPVKKTSKSLKPELPVFVKTTINTLHLACCPSPWVHYKTAALRANKKGKTRHERWQTPVSILLWVDTRRTTFCVFTEVVANSASIWIHGPWHSAKDGRGEVARFTV